MNQFFPLENISFPFGKRVKTKLFEKVKNEFQRSSRLSSHIYSTPAAILGSRHSSSTSQQQSGQQKNQSGLKNNNLRHSTIAFLLNQKPQLGSYLSDESESDFDYETSSTISVEIEEIIEEEIPEIEEEEEAVEEKKNDHEEDEDDDMNHPEIIGSSVIQETLMINEEVKEGKVASPSLNASFKSINISSTTTPKTPATTATTKSEVNQSVLSPSATSSSPASPIPPVSILEKTPASSGNKSVASINKSKSSLRNKSNQKKELEKEEKEAEEAVEEKMNEEISTQPLLQPVIEPNIPKTDQTPKKVSTETKKIIPLEASQKTPSTEQKAEEPVSAPASVSSFVSTIMDEDELGTDRFIYSTVTARGDKSSLLSDKSLLYGKDSAVKSTPGKKSNAVTPKTVEPEPNPAIIPSNLPSSIKKASGRGSIDRRVSFGADLDLSPPPPVASTEAVTPSDSALADMSTVKEDSNIQHNLRSESKNTSTNISELTSITPVNKSATPSKSFSRKSIESVLEQSPKSLITSPSITSPIKSPISSPLTSPVREEKSTISSTRSGMSTRRSSVDSAASTVPESPFQADSKSTLDHSKASRKSTPKSNKSSRSSRRSSVSKIEASSEEEDESNRSTQSLSVSKTKSISEKSNLSLEVSDEKESSIEKSREDESLNEDSKVEELDLSASRSIKTEEAISSASKIKSPEKPLDFAPPDSFSPMENENYDLPQSPAEPIVEETAKNDRASISRISSGGEDTFDHSLDDDKLSTKFTPKSTGGKSTNTSSTTPGSVHTLAISTPGSNEFPRGRRIPDESFHINDSSLLENEDDDEIETDKEELETTALNTDKKSKNKKAHTVSEEDEKPLDLTTTFVDDSFLFTINSANKKYAGKKILEETKKLKHEQKKKEVSVKSRKRLFTKVKGGLSSEEEDNIYEDEDYSDEEDEGMHLRRSKRATKGRRFAFWKGERPIYEEGTVVGVVEPEPTPKKPKRNVEHKRKRTTKQLSESEEESDDENVRLASNNNNKKKARKNSIESEDEIKQKLPPVQLPSNLKVTPADKLNNLSVWDSYFEDIVADSIVCSRTALGPPQALPRTGKRPSGKTGVGLARHLFNFPERPGVMPGWIAG